MVKGSCSLNPQRSLDATARFKTLPNRINLPHIRQNENNELTNGEPFHPIVGTFVRCNGYK